MLVRRGYGDPKRPARSWRANCLVTIRSCSATWPAPSRRSSRRSPAASDLRARRLRRGRDLRHGTRGPHPARARRRRQLAPAEPLRGGLRPPARDPGAARRRGLRARADRRLRRDRGRGDRRGAGSRLEVVVTDHHRPGETLPDCPVVATRPSEYPFPSSAGPASSTSSARLCSAAATRPSRGTSTWSRSRRSRTSCRSWTRTARSRSPACAPSRGRRSRACAR